jgi:N-acetylglucosaminyldiphosphoundecaprenol N-acetyl-beta-D-mannosaminyltransferase
MTPSERRTVSVIGAPIDTLSWEDALGRLRRWADARESRVVCICNVHSVVTARSDDALSAAIRDADMATPDGFPVAAMLRRLGCVGQDRINGPDLMWRYCQEARAGDAAIYLYGGSQATLDALRAQLSRENPALIIAGMHSPPFRELTAEEDEAIVKAINDSGAGIVWVSLGCPKQEKWMAAHRGRTHAVMVGVGAAFDYHAGTLARAPLWMQRHGLEWLHRLASEPKRLWRRYLVTNSLFLLHSAAQLCAELRKRPSSG